MDVGNRVVLTHFVNLCHYIHCILVSTILTATAGLYKIHLTQNFALMNEFLIAVEGLQTKSMN